MKYDKFISKLKFRFHFLEVNKILNSRERKTFKGTPSTGPSSRGEITKNNKCGSIIKDDNFMITCADRST